MKFCIPKFPLKHQRGYIMVDYCDTWYISSMQIMQVPFLSRIIRYIGCFKKASCNGSSTASLQVILKNKRTTSTSYKRQPTTSERIMSISPGGCHFVRVSNSQGAWINVSFSPQPELTSHKKAGVRIWNLSVFGYIIHFFGQVWNYREPLWIPIFWHSH